MEHPGLNVSNFMEHERKGDGKDQESIQLIRDTIWESDKSQENITRNRAKR